jgi:Glycosyltransferases involved in cell wall biogenesis
MPSISLDIVVIGRNEGEFLRESLESVIKAGDYLHKAGYKRPRIIYVDGQSTDGSVELAQKMGIKTYIVEGTPNPAKDRYLGFSKCHGKYVFS